MQRDCSALAESHFDLAIIGGGINGLAAAWDASLRGLSVALVDKGDFGAATSAGSLKLIHGGLRFLQQLDLRSLRESVLERKNLLYLAPHLVHTIPFLIPTYGHGMRGRQLLSIGMKLFETMSIDHNTLSDPSKHIQDHESLSRSQTLGLFPGLKSDRLTGAVVYRDGQMFNSDRLTLSFALSAAQAGARLANYCEAVGFQRKDGAVETVQSKDLLTGSEFEIRARFFLNMTGPWAEITRGYLADPSPNRTMRRSKGIQILTRSLTGDMALGVYSRHKDETAILNRGSRLYFITPWKGYSLVGTTDELFEGDPDEFRIAEEDIVGFIEEINDAFSSAKLRREDVLFAFGGLRPVTERDVDRQGPRLAKVAEIQDHAQDPSPVQNFVTVVGAKYTTCRSLARQVLDVVCDRLNKGGPCRTDQRRLWGGEIEEFESFLRQDLAGAARDLGPEIALHLGRNYGSQFGSILDLLAENPAWAGPVADGRPVLFAEVVRAVREEMAVKLADVILRRTELGSLGFPGEECLKRCGEWMALELNWDSARLEREMDEARTAFEPCIPDDQL